MRGWQTAREIFEIPPELDSASPVPAAVAEALTRCWSPGPARDALRPLVTKLVALGLRYPPSESLEERVDDAVYVMF